MIITPSAALNKIAQTALELGMSMSTRACAHSGLPYAMLTPYLPTKIIPTKIA